MEKDRFKTKNLNIAAFLYASGLQLTGSTRDAGTVFFEFSPKNKAEELVNNYFSDQAMANPKDLFSKLNELRDLIFSSGRLGRDD